ncbi:type IV toxin-antitoxin system AbiEi family antitoxin [Cupriavidus basilensis]|uniref:type IV toxin-antitoxin system AbiEi family antitoxin n=1 Tax=Cupriavidus basilensis TaxID=68895 RepID=UPI00157A5AF5|nr:type IV toxin-antitoxin system AbiEi family antitoxin [Cupriavidus basilensis]NUA29934.1 hypothetical protein [Cupriavidus basilensis]
MSEGTPGSAADLFAVVIEQFRLIQVEMQTCPLEAATAARGRLTAPDRLLDEWVTNYPTILRPGLHARRFAGPDPDWRQDMSLAALKNTCWGRADASGCRRPRRVTPPETPLSENEIGTRGEIVDAWSLPSGAADPAHRPRSA